MDEKHPLGTPEAVMQPVQQNFDQIRPMLEAKADLQQLDALEAWAQSSFERLAAAGRAQARRFHP